MKEMQLPQSPDQAAREATIKDLQALYKMAKYMRQELLRVGSQGFCTTTFLPALLQHEISELQAGRLLTALATRADQKIGLSPR